MQFVFTNCNIGIILPKQLLTIVLFEIVGDVVVKNIISTQTLPYSLYNILRFIPLLANDCY